MKERTDNIVVKLLYVDDNPHDLILIPSILKFKFPQAMIITATNGMEGIESFRSFCPDIVLTDFRMPGMDGIQMSRKIKEIDEEVLILFLTAVCDNGVILEAVDVGISNYVTKPLDMEKLLASVGRCIKLSAARRMADVREESIRRMAYYDPLTGLPNRQLFSKVFHQALAHAQRHKRVLALLYIDIDAFKIVNDTHGHDVGDQLLQVAADRLRYCCRRETDSIARYGGDEFVVLLADPDSSTEASVLAEKIVAAFSMPFFVDEHILTIAASIGIAIYPEGGLSEETLLRNADTAMYTAKRSGGAQFHVLNPDTAGICLDAARPSDY